MIDLEDLSYEELVTLNDEIVDRLNRLDAIQSLLAMAALNIGTKVSFDSKRGRQVGRVIKLNTKTVGIVTDDGRNWKVPPHLLSKVNEISEPNVIKISGKKKIPRGLPRGASFVYVGLMKFILAADYMPEVRYKGL